MRLLKLLALRKILGIVSLVFLTGLGISTSAHAVAPIFSTEEGAIRGYDPVAYFKKNIPVKGKKNFIPRGRKRNGTLAVRKI